MRASIVIALVTAACTGTITGVGGGDHSTVSSRVGDSCAELAATCTASGRDCLGQAAYCGPIQDQIGVFFTAESACKDACTDKSCFDGCKVQRMTGITTMLATASLDGGNTIGTGVNACTDMQQTCTDTGSGCGATEFFCTLARPVQDACYQQLQTCKAACGHDHTCKYDCKQAYLQCEATGSGSGSGTMADAGVPDAPTMTPDAPTTTPDAPTTTTTNYTYTNDIAGVTTGFCSGCHSGAGAPGGYLTDTYQHLFGNGSDNTPNIIPGDGSSLFVVKIQGNHHNVLNAYPGFDKVAYDWVVNNAAQQ